MSGRFLHGHALKLCLGTHTPIQLIIGTHLGVLGESLSSNTVRTLRSFSLYYFARYTEEEDMELYNLFANEVFTVVTQCSKDLPLEFWDTSN